ncbi:MAG TPA: hypothetical protein VF380_00450 [Solirubrobacteraceae bacterium]
MASIVVSGTMLRHPLAENITACMQYLVGLHLLGHDVAYVEDRGWQGSCFDHRSATVGEYPTGGLALVRELLRRYRVDVPVAWVDADVGLVEGMLWPQLRERLAGASVLLDIGGEFGLEERALPRCRALVDAEPLFTDSERFIGSFDYDVHFGYDVNTGGSCCNVPTAGINWLATVPPIVPQLWKAPPPRAASPLSTVVDWMAYRGAGHGGSWYGQDGAVEHLLELPARVGSTLELAISGESERVHRRLRAAGWVLRDADEVNASPAAYSSYIRRSQGEFSVARRAYVSTRSGWLGARSACYLAAGRPVIVQDTGQEEWLATGLGVLTFQDAEDAALAVERVGGDLLMHSRAARVKAREVFHYGVVLERLLERAMPRRLGVIA